MEEVLQTIKEKAQKDRDLIRFLTQLLEECPAGRIQVSTVRRHARHYLIKGGRREYLGKDRSDLAKDLMRKEYYTKLLQTLEEEVKILEKFLACFDPRAAIRVYEDMHEARRNAVEPIVVPEKMFVEKWFEEAKKQAAGRSNSYSRPEEFLTLNGEYVRSKSEKILADTLFHHHIFLITVFIHIKSQRYSTFRALPNKNNVQ